MAKHIPILFSTGMVQAVLEDRKQHTRRTNGLDVVNKHPDEWVYRYWGGSPFKDYTDGKGGFDYPRHDFIHKSDGSVKTIKCQYGQPGDVLWVRETWCLTQPYHPEAYYFGYKHGGHSEYEASEKYDYSTPDVWKPSIHMPKEACRIFLKETGIRVERLQDISEADAKAEGVYPVETTSVEQRYANYNNPSNARHEFSHGLAFEWLWKSINGEQSWNQNPWVWVVEFERCEKPENFI